MKRGRRFRRTVSQKQLRTTVSRPLLKTVMMMLGDSVILSWSLASLHRSEPIPPPPTVRGRGVAVLLPSRPLRLVCARVADHFRMGRVCGMRCGPLSRSTPSLLLGLLLLYPLGAAVIHSRYGCFFVLPLKPVTPWNLSSSLSFLFFFFFFYEMLLAALLFPSSSA